MAFLEKRPKGVDTESSSLLYVLLGPCPSRGALVNKVGSLLQGLTCTDCNMSVFSENSEKF